VAASRNEIVTYLNGLLDIDKIKDSSCNGLQVEGVRNVRRVGLAVDACMAVYKKAAALRCQMLLVHHGLIWNGLTSVTGHNFAHVKFLADHGLSLYAAHLPLDLHAEYGNNALLARALCCIKTQPFGLYKGNLIGVEGVLPRPMTNSEIGRACQRSIGGTFFALDFGKKKNRSVAIVSGGGSDALPEAIEKKIDCFVTGEPAHWNHHAALEAKINVLYLGHYHSEKPGVRALGKKLKETFGVETVFIDEPTLV
jgi:dinuclear metal center YbgI/SA1388 family protein